MDAMPYNDNGPCGNCVYGGIALAYDGAGMADSAITAYERTLDPPSLVPDVSRITTMERICVLADATGRRDKVLRFCDLFVEAWKDADAELQPRVSEARQRLARAQGPPDLAPRGR